MKSEIEIDSNTRVVTLSDSEWNFWGKIIRKSDPEYKYVTANWDLYVFRGAVGYALEVDGKFVSFIASYFNKRRKLGGWGPYINNYLAYTPPEYRGKGYVIKLNQAVEQDAQRCGWERSTSLAAGFTGFMYQLKSGRTFWGLTEGGELRTDTPLGPERSGIGVPFSARDAIDPHPLSETELIEILHSSKRYGNQPPATTREILRKYPLRYDPTSFQHRLV